MNRKENFTAGLHPRKSSIRAVSGMLLHAGHHHITQQCYRHGRFRYYRFDFIQRDYFDDAQDHSG